MVHGQSFYHLFAVKTAYNKLDRKEILILYPIYPNYIDTQLFRVIVSQSISLVPKGAELFQDEPGEKCAAYGDFRFSCKQNTQEGPNLMVTGDITDIHMSMQLRVLCGKCSSVFATHRHTKKCLDIFYSLSKESFPGVSALKGSSIFSCRTCTYACKYIKIIY